MRLWTAELVRINQSGSMTPLTDSGDLASLLGRGRQATSDYDEEF